MPILPLSATPREERKSGPDALTLLRDDHATLWKLFEAYDARTESLLDDIRTRMVTRICIELTVHATLEEEIFYPAVRASLGDRRVLRMLEEAQIEHAGAKQLVTQLETALCSHTLDDKTDSCLRVLHHYVRHHVEQEEQHLYPEIEASALDIDALGRKLADRRIRLKASLQ